MKVKTTFQIISLTNSFFHLKLGSFFIQITKNFVWFQLVLTPQLNPCLSLSLTSYDIIPGTGLYEVSLLSKNILFKKFCTNLIIIITIHRHWINLNCQIFNLWLFNLRDRFFFFDWIYYSINWIIFISIIWRYLSYLICWFLKQIYLQITRSGLPCLFFINCNRFDKFGRAWFHIFPDLFIKLFDMIFSDSFKATFIGRVFIRD